MGADEAETMAWRALLAAGLGALIIANWSPSAIALRQVDYKPINKMIQAEVSASLSLADLLGTADREALLCVATAVFHEARGEPREAQELVAAVIRNRVRERGLSPCEVVYEQFQFSWSKDGLDRIVGSIAKEPAAWIMAERAAYAVMFKYAQAGVTFNHFLNASVVRPSWSRRGREYLKSGRLTFLYIPTR